MTVLSALDFLGLAEQKRVARVDLAEVGLTGHVFVCDLSTAQQQRIMAPRPGTRVRTDRGAMEFDLADMPRDAGSKFMLAALVTDKDGGAQLEAVWEARPAGAEYITFPKSDLVFLADEWRRELKSEREVEKRLEDIPNVVTDLVVRTVRQISGIGDMSDEKKDS